MGWQVTYQWHVTDKHGMDLLVEPVVGNSIESYGNGDENLCSPDENNDQRQMDIYDQNKTNETHREIRLQSVGTNGPTEPEENANLSKDEVVVQPSNFEQEIINEDSEIRHDATMDQTHRPSPCDWRHRFADQYTVPVVLANLSIPKAIKKFGSEALASVMK